MKEYILGFLLLIALNACGQKNNEVQTVLDEIVAHAEEPFGQSAQLTLMNDQFTENNPMQEEAKQWYLILSNLKTWVETGSLMNLPNQQ